MKSARMGSLKLSFSRTGFHKLPCISLPVNRKIGTLSITCGLRDTFRKPIRQSRVLSTEAIQAVHAMKLAKSNSKLEGLFHGRVSRLLKGDLLDTLTELQRQNEVDLALKKEEWYKPDLSLYCDMIQMFGKNELITSAEELFCELQREGLEPDTRAYTEMIGAYLRVGMIDKAMETYGVMKASGCAPDKLTLTMLIRNLDNVGEEELAATVRKECAQYVDYPEKFLEIVAKKHRKRVVDIV